MKKILGLMIILGLAAVPAMAQKVTIDYAHDFDFSTVKTFHYQDTAESNAKNPLMADRIKNSIISELKEGGLQQVEENGDIVVTYHITSKENTNYSTTSFGYGGYWGGWGGWGYGGPGMASSTTTAYTYTEGTLIIDAYDSLGDHTEAAVASSADRPPAQRWVTTAMAIREWAVARPHDYALLYGTPVPGYAAPDDTVAPGIRVSLALISIVADAARSGGLDEPADLVISDDTAASLRGLSRVVTLPDIRDTTMLAIVLAWTQLFGLLTFELFGQTKNFVDNDDLLFRDAATNMARRIGLADR